MKAKEILAQLKTELEEGHTPFEKEVMVRMAERDYAIRGIDTSTAAIVLEVGEEVILEDTRAGDTTEGPGGPEGEGVEPPPPAVGQAIMASDTPQENQES